MAFDWLQKFLLLFLPGSSATERDEWLAAIATAIDDHTRKKITFISSRSQEEVRQCVCARVFCE